MIVLWIQSAKITDHVKGEDLKVAHRRPMVDTLLHIFVQCQRL